MPSLPLALPMAHLDHPSRDYVRLHLRTLHHVGRILSHIGPHSNAHFQGALCYGDNR